MPEFPVTRERADDGTGSASKTRTDPGPPYLQTNCLGRHHSSPRFCPSVHHHCTHRTVFRTVYYSWHPKLTVNHRIPRRSYDHSKDNLDDSSSDSSIFNVRVFFILTLAKRVSCTGPLEVYYDAQVLAKHLLTELMIKYI